MNDVQVLDLTPLGHYSNGLPYYKFGCSFPWVKALETGFSTKEEADADAGKWCRDYEARDVMGNMAAVIGVTEKDSKFFGVVNYFHSNT